MDNKVSFFTICYEGDWKSILIEKRLNQLIRSCNFSFDFRGLIINNVSNRALVESYAQKAVDENIIDGYFFAEDTVNEIFEEFNLTRKSFKLDGYDGYWYSLGPLTAIFQCKTQFLLYFTGDCLMEQNTDPIWISEAKTKLKEGQILVANPLWNYNNGEVKQESIAEDEDWFYGYGFTDQCFLVESSRFKADIYNHYHVSSEAYPIYGGNLFERRVNSFMRKSKLQRITHKQAVFIHEKLLDEGYVPVQGQQKSKVFVQLMGLKKRLRKKINTILNNV